LLILLFAFGVLSCKKQDTPWRHSRADFCRTITVGKGKIQRTLGRAVQKIEDLQKSAPETGMDQKNIWACQDAAALVNQAQHLAEGLDGTRSTLLAGVPGEKSGLILSPIAGPLFDARGPVQDLGIMCKDSGFDRESTSKHLAEIADKTVALLEAQIELCKSTTSPE
jgi:hypothetical protein